MGGISKFEMRKLESGECEGENVGMWCCGVGFERRRPRRCRRYLGGRGGISKFEMRKLEIGECEGENVVLWCGF